MRRDMPYSQLWIIENELNKLPQTSPGIFFLLETKVQQFYQRNQINLKALHSRMHEIQKKYIEHDEKQVPQRIGGEGENAKEWKYLESVIGDNGQLLTGDAIKEEYNKKVEEFLGRVIKVEL